MFKSANKVKGKVVVKGAKKIDPKAKASFGGKKQPAKKQAVFKK